MNVRWIVPTVGVVVSLATAALAQTAPMLAPTLRPALATTVAPVAVTQLSAGVATTVAPVAQPASRTNGFAESFDQAPPSPPTPPAPPSPPAAPQAPQAPQTTRGMRTTGEMQSTPYAAPRNKGQLVNLRLEFTVTDQIGAAPPVKKTITMNVADGESGRIRTNADVFRKNSNPTVVPLSVDAAPEIEGTKIRLRASLEYQLLSDAAGPDLPAGKTSITQSVTTILNDGVSTILSQSADPLTDRKVTLEVKATIIK
jgi:hypothetical protein